MRNILAELYERTVYEQSRENPEHFPMSFAEWERAAEVEKTLQDAGTQCLDCCESVAWAVGYESFLCGFTAGMEFLRWYMAEEWGD